MPSIPSQAGFVSIDNSSTSLLLASATFTGVAEEVAGYATASVFVFTDQASATDGLKLQHSTNGTNWDDTDSYTISASTGKQFSVPIHTRYFRVTYTNGGTNQGVFRLQTIFHNVTPKPSSHRILDTLTGENDAELVSAVAIAKRASGTFAPLASTNSDLLNISIGGSTATTAIVGDKASDVVDDESNPLKIGGIARNGTSNPSAVASGDRVSASFDTYGRLLVTPYQFRGAVSTAFVSLINGTETTLLGGTSGVFNDLVYVLASTTSTWGGPGTNGSAQGSIVVSIRSVRAGGIVTTITVPSAVEVPTVFHPPVPIPQDEAGSSWTVDMDDITGTTVNIQGLFIKN